MYYIQYAHARVCSVMRKLAEQGWNWDSSAALEHLGLLGEEHERSLLRRLDLRCNVMPHYRGVIKNRQRVHVHHAEPRAVPFARDRTRR